jgi:hypothetical protein
LLYNNFLDISPDILNNVLVDFDRKDWDAEKKMYILPPLDKIPKELLTENRVIIDEFGRTRQIDDGEVIVEQSSVDALISSIRPQGSMVGDVHYDDTGEIRTKGVGFYRFSQNEVDRQTQMSDLTTMRQNTLASRTQLMILKEKRKQMKEIRLKKVEERRNRAQSSSNEENS